MLRPEYASLLTAETKYDCHLSRSILQHRAQRSAPPGVVVAPPHVYADFAPLAAAILRARGNDAEVRRLVKAHRPLLTAALRTRAVPAVCDEVFVAMLASCRTEAGVRLLQSLLTTFGDMLQSAPFRAALAAEAELNTPLGRYLRVFRAKNTMA
jgi:hypothetical protein